MARASVALLLFVAACNREAPAPAAEQAHSAPKANAPCTHAACGDGYFVDLKSTQSCKSKQPCEVDVRLETNNGFHINDEYPYKFKADPASDGVQWKSADPANPTTFSKKSGEWEKSAETSGLMKTTLVAQAGGSVPVGGTFKLSVCSAAICQLEQPHVQTTVAVQ